MQAFLLKYAWKLASGVAVLLCVFLGYQLLTANIENRSLGKRVETLQTTNENLTADLAQARTNVATLEGAVDRLSGQILSLSQESQARIKAAEAKLAEARKATEAAQRRASAIQGYQPAGETDAERLLDVDRRFQEMLQ